MLRVEYIQDYFWISGEGLDWYFSPSEPHFLGYGVQGEWFWIRYRSELKIYHAPTQRKLGCVNLPGEEKNVRMKHLASRDGLRLFVFDSVDRNPDVFHAIDLGSATILQSAFNLTGVIRHTPVERPDGKILYLSFNRSESSVETRVCVLDPVSGERAEEAIVEPPYSFEFSNIGFCSVSPDGRHLIRFDHTSLPVRESKVGGFLGIGAKPGPRYYGVTLQIWQAMPLRFLRRVTVAWFQDGEFPDEAHLSGKIAEKAQLTRPALWKALSETLTRLQAEPYSGGAARTEYPKPISDNDAAWNALLKNYKALMESVRPIWWQPDGEAFWADTNSFLTCVGLNGSVSPRLYLERLGLRKGTWRPCAASFTELSALEGRRARVLYPEGEAIFDGCPKLETLPPQAVSIKGDRWIDKGSVAVFKARDEARKKVRALTEEKRQITIPLSEWSEDGVIRAIEALKMEMNKKLFQRAYDGIELRFDLGGKIVTEPEFFIALRERFPSALPALKELIEAYVEVAKRHKFLFSIGEDGAGLFANAVKTLAVLDVGSIPTLLKYGALVDPEHEYFFAGDTVPALIKAHGWTDAVLDFVFWVLIRNYYNTLDDYGYVWREWEMREAAVQRDPVILARHLTTLYAAELTEGKGQNSYGPEGLVQLAKQVTQPHEVWEAAFFAEIERVLRIDLKKY